MTSREGAIRTTKDGLATHLFDRAKRDNDPIVFKYAVDSLGKTQNNLSDSDKALYLKGDTEANTYGVDVEATAAQFIRDYYPLRGEGDIEVKNQGEFEKLLMAAVIDSIDNDFSQIAVNTSVYIQGTSGEYHAEFVEHVGNNTYKTIMDFESNMGEYTSSSAACSEASETAREIANTLSEIEGVLVNVSGSTIQITPSNQ